MSIVYRYWRGAYEDRRKTARGDHEWNDWGWQNKQSCLMQSIQTRRKHPDIAGQQMGGGSQKERERMTGHRHVCSIQTREPLC
jgi:hypothetical protein